MTLALPLPRRFVLAASLWPRSAGDRRNSHRIRARGPRAGRAHSVALPVHVGERWRGGGVVVAADGQLIVATHGIVVRAALDRTLRSVFPIPPLARVEEDDEPGGADEEPEHFRCRWVCAPLALADGSAVVLATPDLLVVDPQGCLVGRASSELADDGGHSPNVTHDGALVVTHISGEVDELADGATRRLGRFGYDIPPPAITDDDALIIVGFAGARLTRLEREGPTRRWSAGTAWLDLLASIDRDGFIACGGLDEHGSLIVDRSGSVVARLDRAAVFTECDGGDWLARSDGQLARVRRDGSRVWSITLEPGGAWRHHAALVDDDGWVYVISGARLLGLDAASGEERFTIELGGSSDAPLAAAAPGVLALVVDDRLVWID